ncbi:ATP-binding protein [Phormidesmis sp. 146-33]
MSNTESEGKSRDELIEELKNLRSQIEYLKQSQACKDALPLQIGKSKAAFPPLEVALESALNGILVVDPEGKILYYNQRFFKQWDIPESIALSRSHHQLLSFVQNYVKDPRHFLAQVSAEYDQLDLESHSLVEFKDGRVFKRYSKPHCVDRKIVGRVISCLDTTVCDPTDAKIVPSEVGWRSLLQNKLELMRAEDLTDQAQSVSSSTNHREELETYVAQIYELQQISAQLRQEIVEHQKTEKALRDSQHVLQAIIDNSPSVIYLTDIQKNFLLINQRYEKTFKVDGQQIIGRSIEDVFSPEIAAEFITNNQTVIESRQPLEVEEVALLEDGLHTYLSVKFPLFNASGTVQAVCGISTDITQRTITAQVKDEFISVVSHELRTPLTSIHGALTLLANNRIDIESERGQRFVKIAAKNADRLVRLVNDVLELERLESSAIALEKHPCNLTNLIADVVDTLQVLAHQAGVTLCVSSHDPEIQSVEVNVNSDRIIQVLTNLINNAIKFSPGGETVWINVEKISDSSSILPNLLQITIKDQGCGIPGDQLEAIFERFHQVRCSDSSQKKGTGLGLAICRSIVQQHGGSIWAESIVGKGSRFYFTIPL